MYIESKEVMKNAILMIINLKIQRQGQGQNSNYKEEIQLSKIWNVHNKN
jgi:hypothetical protein